MADIFISYSSQQRDVTRALAASIEAEHGVGSVWWDQAGLRGGDQFSPEITRALDDAKAVVVVWTHGAVASDWVYAEAVRAAGQRKVVTVRAADLDPKLIPLPFNVYHTCLVDDISAVLAGIAKRLSGEVSELPTALPGPGFLLDPKQEALPARAGVTRPASLLLAKHRLVPFDDMHGLRAEFVQWATAAPAYALGSPALGRLVHAAAGIGKTRALIEIADELVRAHGWLAGFVPRDIRGAGRELSEATLERLILGGRDASGLMLIVDYAESRQEDVVWLADRLLRRAESIATPARLVLQSRGAGEWWRELLRKSQSLQDLCSLGGEAYDVIEIPERIARPDRRSLFAASVEAFRAHRSPLDPHPAEPRPPAADLLRSLDTEDDYDRPLAVQIAALLHVHGVDTGPRHGMAHLLDLILGLEYQHWDKALKIADQPNWQAAIRNGVAQVTLVGGVDSERAAAALIAEDPLYREARDIDVPRARHMLSLIFPGANRGLEGLEPDLIGEHHVLDVIADDGLVDACLDWAGENREPRRRILTVLNRATRAEHGANASRAEAQLARLVATRADVLGGDLIRAGLETPGRLLDLCAAIEAQIDGFEEGALAEIDSALPLQSMALMALSLRVAQRRTDLARKLFATVTSANVPPDLRKNVLYHLAGRVHTLGVRLSALGRREEALASSQEAVDIHRRLAQTRPDAFLPDLAASLNNLGAALSNLGRREEALASSQEAVDICRRLALTRPEAFLPELAGSLNNLARDLSALGRREEALASSQEAVDIHRRLAQTRPHAFLTALAMSLNNLCGHLSDLGRREEALAASQEAVDIYRRLAQTHPDAFLPDLAASLNNLGMSLSNLGRREETLAASQEAVDIYRRLAQTRPDAFLPDLAASLNNIGNFLSALGRREEALAASQEAVDIYRRLAQTRPDAFLPDLAMSLNSLGNRLSDLGRSEEALAASQEAVDIYRRLAQTRPDAFLPDLATSLGARGRILTGVERHEAAAAAFREGFYAIAPFVERSAQAFGELAKALARDYVAACEAMGAEPDMPLLGRIVRSLGL